MHATYTHSYTHTFVREHYAQVVRSMCGSVALAREPSGPGHTHGEGRPRLSGGAKPRNNFSPPNSFKSSLPTAFRIPPQLLHKLPTLAPCARMP